MSWLKAIEVLGVLAAGLAFAWWQFSDLAKARRDTEAGRKDKPGSRDAGACERPAQGPGPNPVEVSRDNPRTEDPR